MRLSAILEGSSELLNFFGIFFFKGSGGFLRHLKSCSRFFEVLCLGMIGLLEEILLKDPSKRFLLRIV